MHSQQKKLFCPAVHVAHVPVRSLLVVELLLAVHARNLERIWVVLADALMLLHVPGLRKDLVAPLKAALELKRHKLFKFIRNK